MKGSRDRWDFIAEQLEELKIAYSRLEAFDVSRLSDEMLARYSQSWERPLRNAEVSCFLSHKAAWQRVVEKNEPFLILEDDVILSKDTGKILSHFHQANDYGLINLETTHRLKLIGNSEVRINHKYSLRRLLHNKTGAAAYIIWPSFAKKLLLKFSDQSAALADAALYTNFFGTKQYQLSPAPAVQLQYADAFNIKQPLTTKSTISLDKSKKKYGLKFLKRRIKTQILIILVYIVNIFHGKRKKIDLL